MTKNSQQIDLLAMNVTWFPKDFEVRVANVVTVHDDLLTQWRPIQMSKFRTNIFFTQTTSNYFQLTHFFNLEHFFYWEDENKWLLKLWFLKTSEAQN